jgi:hypothetical protein
LCIAAALSSALVQDARASVIGQFTPNGGGLVKGSAGPKLCWDLTPGAGGFSPNHCFTIDTSKGTGAGGDVTNGDVANQLAADINNTVGKDTASASGSQVQTPNFTPSENLAKNQYSFDMDTLYSTAGLGTSINFRPDLNTGSTVLTGPGSFDITGPGGLDASFSAAAGTSDTALAQELSSLMNADGYNTSVVGSGVYFQTVMAGGISVEAAGDGVDVAFGPAPEPATLQLFAAGGLLVAAGCWRRRRRAPE